MSCFKNIFAASADQNVFFVCLLLAIKELVIASLINTFSCALSVENEKAQNSTLAWRRFLKELFMSRKISRLMNLDIISAEDL